MDTLTLGADPECFVADATSVRSIIGKIGGTKQHPLPLMELGEGFAVQEDNVALEFNIPASPTKSSFIANITMAVDFLGKLMQDRYGYNISHVSAASFPDTELTNPNALIFGCDPDFNAWTGEKNPRPAATDPNLRSAGGHVHVGCNLSKRQKVLSVRAMDLFLGVPSVLVDHGEERKMLYGKAGAHRMKKYGFEYRTLSNFWIFDEKLIAWVYDNTNAALDAVQNNLPFDVDAENIQSAINNNDKDLALNLIMKYGIGMPNA